jgi:predicted permease
MSWITRLKNTMSPQRLDADLSDEIRDHLERRSVDFERSGLSPSEARRHAGLRFGNVTAFREESREVRLSGEIEKTWQDLRYAVRGLARNPALALTGVLSIGLAIGANTAVFSVVNAASLRPLPVADPQRLFTLAASDRSSGEFPGATDLDLFSYPLYAELREAAGASARIALFAPPNRVDAQLDGPDSSYEQANQQLLSPDAFDILGITPALGRLFSRSEDRYPSPRAVTAISYGYWQRRFAGDPGILGRSIVLDGRIYRVLGVARRGFSGAEPGRPVDFWLPVTVTDPGVFTNPNARFFRLIGRLAPGMNRPTLAVRLESAFHHHQEQRVASDLGMPAALRKQLSTETLDVGPGAHGISSFGRTYSRPLQILGIVSFCALLIACTNLAGLLLARSEARSAEIALRVSLGAGRTRLLRQLFTESLLMLSVAGVAGWVLAGVAAPVLVAMISTRANPVNLDLSPDRLSLLFSAATCGISVCIVGFMPAWQATSAVPTNGLRQFGRVTDRQRMGRFFVAAQVAFAFCLVTLASGFLYTFRNLTSLDPGFSAPGVSVLTITSSLQDHDRQLELLRQAQARVATLPNVQATATAWMPVLSGARRAQRVVLPGRQPSEGQVTFYRISPGYFNTLRTPLLAGRDFSVKDNDDEPVPTVVNRAFSTAYFGTNLAIGREFRRDDGVRHKIVGLAADSHFEDLRNGPEPIAYMPMKPARAFTLYVRSGLDAVSLKRIVDREVKTLGSGLRVRDVTTLEAIVGNTIVRERVLAFVGVTFAALGLLLAAIGIFGVLNYKVTRRKTEIGVRGALGAGRAAICGLILKDTAGMMGGGLIAGAVASVILMPLAQSVFYNIRPADPLVLGTALVSFLGVALIASGIPAYRAATINPIEALRNE